MSVVLSVLLAVEESEESSGGVFGLIWFAGSGWGLWHLNKRRKREGLTDWLGAVVVAFTVWWFFLLQVLVKACWKSRQNKRAATKQPYNTDGRSWPTDRSHTGRIPVRIPRDADDFETVCAEWMAQAGFPDAQRTPKGPDGGIDVIAADAIGQAKFHPGNKVPPQAVRALVGSRVQYGKRRALFFHYGPGYTPDAISTALSTGIELYQLDVDSRRFERVA
jgi:hypothetical protein